VRRLTLLTALVGLGLLAWLLSRAGVERVWAEAQHIGWRALLLVPLSLVWLIPNTLGWGFAFYPGSGTVPFLHLFAARLSGEAVNVAMPGGYLGGEPIKAALASTWVGSGPALSSLVVAKLTQMLALLSYVLLGIGLAVLRAPLPPSLQTVAVAVPIGLAAAALIVGLGSSTGLLGRAARVGLRRWPSGWRFVLLNKIVEIDAVLRAFYREHKLRLALSTGSYLCGWVFGATEVWAIAGWMGRPIDPVAAIVISSMSTVARVGMFFVPAGIGAYEAATYAAASMVGLPPGAAVTLALVRRLREVFWVSVGLLLLSVYRPGARQRAREGDEVPRLGRRPASSRSGHP
jgi:uncharacterized membrane protein YbhN (UPF0104 family)